MITVKTLEGLTLDALFVAFSQAFADYQRSWTREEFEKMLYRRSFDPALSFGAIEHEELVAFTFNGTGTYNGIPSAYDTGTGTLKSHRGKGLTKEIFNATIPYLVRAGLKQYVLEVLQHNTTAVKIYTDLGFEITREFNYFVHPVEKTKTNNNNLQPPFQLRELTALLPEEMKAMWDFHPSWQNTFDALNKKLADFAIIGAYNKDQLAGYGIIEKSTGDIPQLAVHPNFRRMGIGASILNGLLQKNKAPLIRLINAEVSCENLTRFLAAHDISVTGTQFEMVKTIP